MSNVNVKIEKQGGVDVLTVTVPLNPRPSASGKTKVVASTNGNHASTVMYEGKPVIVGLNAYVK